MAHKFDKKQADKLVKIRRGIDRGTHTEKQLIAEVRASNALELDDAMEQYDADDYQSWRG
jgi:hypothetical protein